MAKRRRNNLERAAKEFQKLRRAQYAVRDDAQVAVVGGRATEIHVPMGFCACVTCGKVLPWTGRGCIQGGHFIPRQYRPVMLMSANIHVQCPGCNLYKGGAPIEYELYMDRVYGPKHVAWLRDYAVNGKFKIPKGDLKVFRAECTKEIKRLVKIMEDADE